LEKTLVYNENLLLNVTNRIQQQITKTICQKRHRRTPFNTERYHNWLDKRQRHYRIHDLH